VTAKYHLGPHGVNAWDGKKAVLRVAHTLEKPGAWTLEKSLADIIFSEICASLRVRRGEPIAICPTCFSLNGQKTLVFIDVRNGVRGPSCPNCLKLFFAKYPNTLGYRLYVFSVRPAEIAYVREKAPARDTSRLEQLRKDPIPLKTLI